MSLLALIVAGCDEPRPDPTVEIGSSDEPLRHGPLAEGDTVWITYGLQGGYHIWGSLRAEHIRPDDVRMQFALFADGDPIGGADYRDDVRRGPDGAFEYGAVTVFIYDDVAPESLDGQTIEMTLRLTAGDGAVVDDRVRVRARCCE